MRRRDHLSSTMPVVTQPEIQRVSLLSAALLVKALPPSLGLDVLSFPFVDPPEREAMEEAVKQLYVLTALAKDGVLTHVGRAMAMLPLEPNLARMVVEGIMLGYVDGPRGWWERILTY